MFRCIINGRIVGRFASCMKAVSYLDANGGVGEVLTPHGFRLPAPPADDVTDAEAAAYEALHDAVIARRVQPGDVVRRGLSPAAVEALVVAVWRDTVEVESDDRRLPRGRQTWRHGEYVVV